MKKLPETKRKRGRGGVDKDGEVVSGALETFEAREANEGDGGVVVTGTGGAVGYHEGDRGGGGDYVNGCMPIF